MHREEREEERYVIRSITFQDQVSVSFNRLNQRWSLKEFRTECIKAHFLIVGVSRGYTDYHQGRAIHMADSRIH